MHTYTHIHTYTPIISMIHFGKKKYSINSIRYTAGKHMDYIQYKSVAICQYYNNLAFLSAIHF